MALLPQLLTSFVPMRPVPPMTTIFMILPSKPIWSVRLFVFDRTDAGRSAGKPCGGLEAH